MHILLYVLAAYVVALMFTGLAAWLHFRERRSIKLASPKSTLPTTTAAAAA